MSRKPRFEIVRTDAEWHARFRAANGRIVWTTETYTRRGKVVAAVELICNDALYLSPFQAHPEIAFGSVGLVEVRDVDERTGDCPTCTWPRRETSGLVCQTCGWDYANGEKP